MRILVIEDEHKLAGVLKRGLEEHGYAVDVAYDGEDGLALATAAPYDRATTAAHDPRHGLPVARSFGVNSVREPRRRVGAGAGDCRMGHTSARRPDQRRE